MRYARSGLLALFASLGALVACGDQPLLGTVEIEPAPAPPDDGPLDRHTWDPYGPIDKPSEEPGCEPNTLAERVSDRGEAFRPDGRVRSGVSPCEVALYRGVAAREMTLVAELTTLDGSQPVRLLRFDSHELNDDLSVEAERVETVEGAAAMTWTAARTGQYGLVVEPADEIAEARYRLAVHCLEGCDAGMTRYPIVLLHGMGGSDAFFDLFEYFRDVETRLEEDGFDVFVTVVDPLVSSSVRAEQLAVQLEAILDETGAGRVNLIGHSQGGLDGRALIVEQEFGDRVASLTTLATPHRGTELADILAGIVDGNELGQRLLDEVGDVYGQLLGRDGDQSLPTALRELGAEHMLNTFNPSHPDDPRVAYYSWTGRTCAAIELGCRRTMNGEVVNPLLAPSYRAMQLVGAERNDGLVSVESARWGEFLGTLPADHLSEVGYAVDSSTENWSHIDFFRAEGDRLLARGH